MNEPSLLPEGLRVVGDVESGEDFVVCGEIDGEVRVAGALVIEPGGTVRGPVEATVVIVRGVLVGDAHALEMIRVDARGRMVGEAKAPRVNVVEGAMFRGRVELVGQGEPRIPRIPRRATSAGQLVAPTASSVRTTPGLIAAPSLPTRAAAKTEVMNVVAAKTEPAKLEPAAPQPAKLEAAKPAARVRPAPRMPRVERTVAAKREG